MLFGRGRECERIDRLLVDTRRGASGVLLVCGEPGIGKTSLLSYAVEVAGDLRVLPVTGVEPESVLPFAALGRLLGPVLEHLPSIPARQAAALRGALALEAPEPGDRFAVYTATFGLLMAAADRVPTLIVVDDAQWLDPPTAEALAFAARRLRADGVAMLVGAREPGAFSEFEALLLRGLDDASAVALLESRLPAAPAGDLMRALAGELAGELGGNPLALREVGDTLTPDELTGRRPLRRPLPAAATAEKIFGRRVAALDEAARRALQVAAVAANDGAAAVLTALAAAGLGSAALEQLEETGLITTADDQIGFVHPLLRTAALAGLAPAQLRALHRIVAGVLSGPRDAGGRAWHLAEAALGPDETAAVALEEAADLARGRSGYAAAALALERAAHLSTDDGVRARRLFAAADAARLAGRPDVSLRLLAECGAYTTDPRLQGEIAGLRGRIELFMGRAAVARETLQAGSATVAELDPGRSSALLADAAAAAYVAWDARGAIEMARRASVSAACGDRNTQLIAKVVVAFSLLLTGRADEGVPQLREAAALAEHAGPGALDVEYVLFAALGLVWYGEASAHALVDPLLRDLRAHGALGHLPFALYVSALADSRLGRLDSGRIAAAEAADMAADTGNLLWRMLSLGCQALLEAQRGDEQACRAHAAESLRLRERADLVAGRDALDALGLLELSLRRPDRAITYFERVNRCDDQPVVGRASAIDLIEAYLRTGRPVPASMLEQLHRFTARDFPAAFAALLWRGRAMLADEQRFDDGFGRALALHGISPSTFETARTLLCYGERLRRAGRRRDATRHLEPALETFERIGARLWSDRAAAELRAAGGPAVATRGGDSRDALTVQELQAARLAAHGATNREIAAHLFLSVKTIEMHLGRVYRKLGVRSRTQLANLLRGDEVA